MTKARSLSDFIESDGSVTLVDNQKIKVGTGNDLEIYHSGSQSIISDVGGGNLNLEGDSKIVLRSPGGSENYAQFFKDGAVELYYDNAAKLATTSTGISVTGNVTLSGTVDGVDIAAFKTSFDNLSTDIVNDTTPQLGGALDVNGHSISFGDNEKTRFGNADDLQIYHDGSNSYIKDAGTGDLYIQGEANVRITDGDGNKMFLGQNDGEVQLYHNGSEKLNTTSTGVTVTGKVLADELDINGLADIQVSHSSTDVTAANSNSTLRIGNSGAGDGIYNAIKFSGNQQDMYMMSINDSQSADRRFGFFVGSVAGDATTDEKLSIRGNGYINMAGAADVRLTLGSTGTAGNNDSNWIRGENSDLAFNAASGDHKWEVGGTPVARLDADGLRFGSDTAAVNALGDYEEGSWTPEIDGGSGGAYTMGGMNTGRYTKVGDLVFVTCTIEWTGRTTAYSGHLIVKGLPYACGDVRAVGQLAAIYYGLSFSSGTYDNYFSWNIDPNLNYAYIIQNGDGTYSHNPTVGSTGRIYTASLLYRAT